MADRCFACRTPVSADRPVCVGCGACSDEGPSGYSGRPGAILAARWLLVVGWGLWCLILLDALPIGLHFTALLPPLTGLVAMLAMLFAAKADNPRLWTPAVVQGGFWFAWVCLTWIIWTFGPFVFQPALTLGGDSIWLAEIAPALACLMIGGPMVLVAWSRPVTVRVPGTCVICGYDLRGLPQARCPECGTPFDRIEIVREAPSIQPGPPRPGEPGEVQQSAPPRPSEEEPG